MKYTTIWMATLLVGTGCGTKPLDLGNDRDPALIGASLSDYEGTWVGYAELAEWTDGTDDVRIALDAQGNGILEVGQAAPLDPPVVDDGYPRYWDDGGMGPSPDGLFSGFSYPITGAVVESNRIRLQTHSDELFREYCDIQTPMPIPSEPGFNCTGYDTYSSGFEGCHVPTADGGEETIDCDRLMCMSRCTCTESECHPWMLDEPLNTRIDAELMNDGEELVGSFAVPRYGEDPLIYRVVMTRE